MSTALGLLLVVVILAMYLWTPRTRKGVLVYCGIVFTLMMIWLVVRHVQKKAGGDRRNVTQVYCVPVLPSGFARMPDVHRPKWRGKGTDGRGERCQEPFP